MQRQEFEKLAAGLRPRLLSTARTILGSVDEADDAVQDTLIKLWFFKDKLSNYENPAAPAAVILRRVCISAIRSRRSTADLDEAMTVEFQTYSDTIDPDMLEAIEELPKMEQAVLKMKHIEGMETEEIASLIGSKPGAVRTALSRARKRVRDIYLNSKA